MNRTWIVVADAAQARLFEIPNPGEPWQLLEEFLNPHGHTRSRDFIREENGGVQHHEGSMFRNAMEPLSIKKVEAQRFARELADLLDKELTRNRYDRLILVAAPEFLGMLRKQITPAVDRRVVDTIAKDYGRSNPRDLQRQLTITYLD